MKRNDFQSLCEAINVRNANGDLIEINVFQIELLNALPEQFSRKEAVLIGYKKDLSIRCVDKYLRHLTETGFLARCPRNEIFKYGYYRKIHIKEIAAAFQNDKD